MVSKEETDSLKKSKKTNWILLKLCLGSETGSISDVLIKDCTKAPCIFHKGENYTLNLKFTSSIIKKNFL